MQVDKIPVLLLTGYLGSGKTTLLNRILSNKKGIRFAVIVNDIGEVNIDATLIQKGGIVAEKDDNLIALQNGCICCSLKMDLVQQLRDLCAADSFDYIVIEASGICEPAPIAQTICSYPSMIPASSAPLPSLDAVVTVVDTLRLRDEFSVGDDLQRDHVKEEDIAALVVEQIEFCNLILLNKVSMVSVEECKHIRAILRAIQPKAQIIECDYCDVPFSEILDTELFDFEQVATSAAWIQGVEGDSDDDHNHHEHPHHRHDEHCHCHEHHDHDHECEDPHCSCHHHHHNHGDEYGISTFVYYRRRPMSLNRFDEFVARHWDKGVIRCKGICYFEEEYDMCYLFEQAGKQFDLKQAGVFYATMPEEELMQMMSQDSMLQRDWDDCYGDRMQKLVFIGQNMDEKAICQALDNCLV
jgi:G3E family GTPase